MSLNIVVKLIAQVRSKTINHQKFSYFQLTFLIIMIKIFKPCKSNIIIGIANWASCKANMVRKVVLYPFFQDVDTSKYDYRWYITFSVTDCFYRGNVILVVRIHKKQRLLYIHKNDPICFSTLNPKACLIYILCIFICCP